MSMSASNLNELSLKDLWIALAIFLVAIAVRSAELGFEPIHDELYHLLAGESWAQDRTLRIADGVYKRAAWFTALIGWVYAIVDGDVENIRMVGVLTGSLLVISVFLVVARIADRRAGLIAAAILCLMPGAIYMSQIIRFYSLQARLFWLGTAAVDGALAGGRNVYAKSALLLVAAISFSISIHLQITTLIGLAGIGLWIGWASAGRIWGWIQNLSNVSRGLIALLLIIIFFSMVFALQATIADLYARFNGQTIWSQSTGPLYYFHLFRDQYGWLFAFLPLVAWLSFSRFRSQTALCIAVFMVAFILHSLAGMRAERFLLYTYPFFAAIWGMAGSVIIEKIYSMNLWQFRGSRWLAASLVGFVVLTIPATELVTRMILDRPGYRPVYWSLSDQTSWRSAQEFLSTQASVKSVFVTTQGLHALYYVGDYDIELSATALSDFHLSPDVMRVDPRTGRPTIGSEQSLAALVAESSSGIVVIHRDGWDKASYIDDELIDYLTGNLTRVDVPTSWGFIIFEW